MSRRGNCHGNAVAESFFNLLKRERMGMSRLMLKSGNRRRWHECYAALAV